MIFSWRIRIRIGRCSPCSLKLLYCFVVLIAGKSSATLLSRSVLASLTSWGWSLLLQISSPPIATSAVRSLLVLLGCQTAYRSARCFMGNKSIVLFFGRIVQSCSDIDWLVTSLLAAYRSCLNGPLLHWLSKHVDCGSRKEGRSSGKRCLRSLRFTFLISLFTLRSTSPSRRNATVGTHLVRKISSEFLFPHIG